MGLKLERTNQNSLDRSTSNNTFYMYSTCTITRKKVISTYACWSELYLIGLETILKFTTNGQRTCSFKEESFFQQDNTKLLRNCSKLFLRHVVGNLELWLTCVNFTLCTFPGLFYLTLNHQTHTTAQAEFSGNFVKLENHTRFQPWVLFK